MSPNLQKVWDFEVIPQLWGALENFLLVKTSKHGYLKCSPWFFLCVRKKINVIRHLSQKIFRKNVLKVPKIKGSPPSTVGRCPKLRPPREMSTGRSRGWGGDVTCHGRSPVLQPKNFKTLKYFFKHPIKNILTIWRLKKFLHGPVGLVGVRSEGGGPTCGHFPKSPYTKFKKRLFLLSPKEKNLLGIWNLGGNQLGWKLLVTPF